MTKNDNSIKAFFELVRGGLWEKEVHLSRFKDIVFSQVISLAEDQAVVGLVAAGLEHVSEVKVPQNVALVFAGTTLQLEQRNVSMNLFVSKLIEGLRKESIYTILVKGQGIAQCYERPLWRAAGDVDLLVSGSEFEKAQDYLLSIGERTEEDKEYKKHSEIQVGTWDVELHGTMRGEVKRSIDRVIDEVQQNVFYNGTVRSWQNGRTTVFLPAPDEDVIIVFTHILQHFFREGVGVRQICDWCRLMWTYKDSLNHRLLESRIRKAGVLSEWKAFAVLAVAPPTNR